MYNNEGADRVRGGGGEEKREGGGKRKNLRARSARRSKKGDKGREGGEALSTPQQCFWYKWEWFLVFEFQKVELCAATFISRYFIWLINIVIMNSKVNNGTVAKRYFGAINLTAGTISL